MSARTAAACFLIAVALGVAGASAFSEGVLGVRAGTASNLARIPNGNQVLWNYDFGTKKAEPRQVDWPVNLIFTKNATIRKVRKLLKAFGFTGANQYSFFKTGKSGGWQADSGRKTDPCSSFFKFGVPFDYHLRLYGDFYSKKWGHWVVATSHQDHGDCKKAHDPDTTFGWNEDSEHFVADYLRKRGLTVHENSNRFNFGNSINRWEGNHFYQNDGRATQVVVK